jgi:microcystin-dependent protein
VASQPYIGAIFLFAGTFVPRGYMLCQGQLLPINQYAALYSLLGTTYGGNGQSTFGLPDLRARAPIGAGQGPGTSNVTLGELAGIENASILISNMPQHNHAVAAVTSAGNQTSPTGNLPAAIGVTHPVPDFPGLASYSNATANTTMAPTQLTGGSLPMNVRNPYLGINYIIAIAGIFPTRS